MDLQPGTDALLPIVSVSSAPVDGEKGIFSSRSVTNVAVGLVDPATLVHNLSAVTQRLGSMFHRLSATAGDFELESFEVSLEITAQGEVRMIGSVSAGVQGGLALTFRRRAEGGP